MLRKKQSVHRCISQPFALVAFPTRASPAMSSPIFPGGFPTEVLVRIMSYAFGPYREGRVVEQCWATDGPDCRGVQAKTLLPVGSIVKLQRSVMCDIGFLRALCLYDDEYGIEQTRWITVETKNNFKVYIKQILSVPPLQVRAGADESLSKNTQSERAQRRQLHHWAKEAQSGEARRRAQQQRHHDWAEEVQWCRAHQRQQHHGADQAQCGRSQQRHRVISAAASASPTK